MTLKITLQYDGTDFVGWQRQARGISVQGVLESALARLDGEPVAVVGAGRTDAGVHALGQVASARVKTRLDGPDLRRALNAILPPTIRVTDVERAPDGFHARFCASAKSYRYRVVLGEVMPPFLRAYAWHVRGPLDVPAMRDAAARLIGEHDFAAFRASGSHVRDTVRRLSRSDIVAPGSDILVPGTAGDVHRDHMPCPGAAVLEYDVSGNGFLRHMVRTIVGTLVEVGRGRRAAESMDQLLASRDRALAGPTAPPQGLFLVAIEYAAGPACY